jgi:MFS family permease
VSTSSPAPAPTISTFTRWLIVAIASIGFAFDIYELLMLPLILRPATQELAGALPGSDAFNHWKALMFYVPALFGGVFGLLGGYMTDLFGRRRVLVWSILLYAVSAFLGGFSTSMTMLLVLRTTKFIGVCVEFVAAVAWLAELFTDHRQRERVLGFSQAFSSFGGLLVAVVNGWIVDNHGMLPAVNIPAFLTGVFGQVQDASSPWRYTMMSGLIPAIPLIVIRPFLPESPTWRIKKEAGTLKRPSILAIFAPELRRTTIVTTLMVAANYGAAFGAIQQMPDIVPGLKDVQETVSAAQDRARAKVIADAEKAGKTPDPKAVERAAMAARKPIENATATEYTKVQEIGGLFGRLAFAMIAASALSQRWLLRKFQIPGMLVVPLVFFLFLKIPNSHFFEINLEWAYLGRLPITTMSLGMMLAGFFTVSQFSFWGNYLPRVYPTHLRGTGESFAANVGGRMIGTSFAAVAATLAGEHFFGEDSTLNYAMVAGCIALAVYACGFLLSFALPEPTRDLEV